MRNSALSLLAGRAKRAVCPWTVVAVMAALSATPRALAQQEGQKNPDWPCQQILVRRIAVAAVWSGPPVEGVAWRNDATVAALVAEIAARRTPLQDAEGKIEAFARSQAAAKADRLTEVFAGLYETLNEERTQVINGLLRFGAKQRELAAKIRAQSASTRGSGSKLSTKNGLQAKDKSPPDLEWDLRVFDERHKSLSFACESPTLIEQRLFALARAIQRNVE